MKTLRSEIAGCILLLVVPHVALAQQAAKPKNADAAQLQEVIVTGTRSEKAVDKIPGAVTIISPQEIERTLALTEDATSILARSVPGYSESSQALNTFGETLRGRVPLRLFDGIPQSTPLRDTNRSGTFTDMEVVGRVEIINGPSAAEGIGAAGGIINYISKAPAEDGTKISLTARVGSQFRSDSEVWKIGASVAHKSDAFDVVASGTYTQRGITYDANGRRIGLSASTSLADSESDNLFLKVGKNFGPDAQQRLELSLSRFKLNSQGNYRWSVGNRALGISDTALPGPPRGTNGISLAGTEFNDFEQEVIRYRHGALFGGTFTADAYRAEQAMRFGADNGADRQDPLIAPAGTLVDQSEVLSRKRGLRASWTRPTLFGADGLEMQIGADYVRDETQQRLALTNRVWVPPMDYTSIAPYLQLSYDVGPLTFSGGVRREDGELAVDDYTTTFFRNRSFVRGGTLSYKDSLPNVGVIWRVADGWSVYGSYSEGFTLPNVGIPLRNINVPGKTVASILDLQAIVFDNREVGFNWRGGPVTLGASYYKSESELGASLSIDPVTRDFVLNRAPVSIKGFELTTGYRASEAWRFTALYSRVRGETTTAGQPNGPLNVRLGVANISPDKLSASAEWRFLPSASVVLGATSLASVEINKGLGTAENIRGYTLLDLTVNYETERMGAFSLGVENLTDKFYFLSFSQIDFFQNYFAGRGRMVSLTYKIEL